MLLIACTACGGKDGAAQNTGVTQAQAAGRIPSRQGDALTITYGHGFNPGTPQAKAADEFKRVEEESGGRISVEVFRQVSWGQPGNV